MADLVSQVNVLMNLRGRRIVRNSLMLIIYIIIIAGTFVTVIATVIATMVVATPHWTKELRERTI